jgi:hypothetical protein
VEGQSQTPRPKKKIIATHNTRQIEKNQNKTRMEERKMLELTYHWEGDYLIPDLEPPEAPRIGKYGTMRHNYLRDYHRGIFDGMLLSGKLNAHLEEIDQQANEMMERLTTQMAQREGVTEALKARDQMAWVQAMNSIKNRAEEIVTRELLFV